MVDVAMDLHKRHTQIGTLDEWGEVQQMRIEHDGDSREMEKFLGGLEAGSRIAVEATGNWWWVVDLAEKHGHEVVLSNPKKTRLIADACLKNDRVDTDQLLHLLRLGYLPRVQELRDFGLQRRWSGSTLPGGQFPPPPACSACAARTLRWHGHIARGDTRGLRRCS